MFRRCITTLVLFGFVASQLVAVPHAHAHCSPEQQREHDARPHVHVGSYGHSHDHSPSQGGHSHGQPTDNQPSVDDEKLPIGAGASYAEHDVDAIYLPGRAASPLAIKDQRTAGSAGPIHSADIGLCANFFQVAQPSLSALHRPPNDGLAGAKLFLTLRHLRI